MAMSSFNLKKSVEPAANIKALSLQDFLEHFELTLLCILHPRYNSIPAENRMGDTLSPKITDKALYIQHLDRSRTTAMDGGSAGFAGAIHRSIQLIYLGLYCAVII